MNQAEARMECSGVQSDVRSNWRSAKAAMLRSLGVNCRAARSRMLLCTTIIFAFILITPPAIRADGIDIVWLITRVGGPGIHPVVGAVVVVVLLAINYLLNLVALGVPAARALGTSVRTLAKALLGFTLLAQVADRISAVAGFLLGALFSDLLGGKGEQGLVMALWIGIVLNFVISGLAIFLLALWYLLRKWQVIRSSSIRIAAVAALITNPAWVMMIQWLITQAVVHVFSS
jgi:hypothetical protein